VKHTFLIGAAAALSAALAVPGIAGFADTYDRRGNYKGSF
jgi:hypothetical protein